MHLVPNLSYKKSLAAGIVAIAIAGVITAGSAGALTGNHFPKTLEAASASATSAKHISGSQLGGLTGELLLPAPLSVTNAGGPPMPPPVLSLSEAAIKGAWLPSWLPSAALTSAAAEHRTVTGQHIISVDWQVAHSGAVLPVRILQIQRGGAQYASSLPLELDYGLVSMMEQQTKQQLERAYAGVFGPSHLALARYSAIAVRGQPAQAILIPETPAGRSLNGVLWREGDWQFYVAGYLPLTDILKIAESLVPR